MGSQAEVEYAAFEEKVRRTVYIDNLSPQATESGLRAALDQFGTVKNVHFIPNYMEPRNIPQCALVEMGDSKHAENIVSTLAEFPFMMSGMPRLVMARAAEVEMFDDRPIKPGRKIAFRWLDPTHDEFEVARKLKRIVRKHADEASVLLEQQLALEEKLANQQAQTLKANYNKYKMVDSVMADGTTHSLAWRYNLRVADD